MAITALSFRHTQVGGFLQVLEFQGGAIQLACFEGSETCPSPAAGPAGTALTCIKEYTQKKVVASLRLDSSLLVLRPAGTPSITVPMGLAAGLPAGLSFLGRPFDEGSLLRVAHAYEQATLHRQPPPLFKECTDPPPAGRPLEQSQIAAAGR